MISEVAPVQTVQLIAGGKVVLEQAVPAGKGQGQWIELERAVELSAFVLDRGAGIRRRPLPARPTPRRIPTRSTSTSDGKAPYDRDSLDRLVARIDQQMAVHRKRSFAEKARVLDDFQKSRDILLRIRQTGGLPAGGVPDDLDR